MNASISILVADDHVDVALASIANMLREAAPGQDVTQRPPWKDVLIGGDVFTIECDLAATSEELCPRFLDATKRQELGKYDLILLDNSWESNQVPGGFGIELLEQAKWKRGEGPFLAIYTIAPDFQPGFVARAIAAGADALIHKNEAIHLLNCIFAAIERSRTREAWIRWRELSGLLAESDSALTSKSPKMQHTLRLLADYAVWPNEPILLLGPPGTGKTRLAKAIHRCSSRSDKPFERVDLGGMNENLIVADLFGTEPGAFTGAISRKGIIDIAEGGTVFIDEVQNIPHALQKTLLSIIWEKTYRRPGSDFERHANIRFIFSSNRDLEELVKAGRLPADFYSRISGCTVRIPALAERKEDIPHLAGYFVADFLRENALDETSVTVTDPAVAALSERNWPDNLRGLRSTIRRSVMRLKNRAVLDAGDLDFGGVAAESSAEFGQTDAIKALKAAPRAGGQRRIFDRLLDRAPACVPDSELFSLVTDVNNGDEEMLSQALFQAISRLRNRLRREGIDIVRDAVNRGYKLHRAS